MYPCPFWNYSRWLILPWKIKLTCPSYHYPPEKITIRSPLKIPKNPKSFLSKHHKNHQNHPPFDQAIFVSAFSPRAVRRVQSPIAGPAATRVQDHPLSNAGLAHGGVGWDEKYGGFFHGDFSGFVVKKCLTHVDVTIKNRGMLLDLFSNEESTSPSSGCHHELLRYASTTRRSEGQTLTEMSLVRPAR